MEPYVIKLKELGMDDVETVGGKNASLGEMISNLGNLGVDVPGGFATTSTAYRDFLKADGLDQRIHDLLADLDVDDIGALTSAGKNIRTWIMEAELPERLMSEIKSAWEEMADGRDIAVAVRSSATAEDLPDASFAGQQETFLNVRGFDHLIDAHIRFLLRCSMIVRSRTACTRALITPSSHYLLVFSTWCVATSDQPA